MAGEQKIALKLNKDLKYSLFSPAERQSWKNLDVNIESYCDKWDIFHNEFQVQLSKFTEGQLKDLCIKYKIKKSPKDPTYYYSFMGNIKASVELYCVMKFVDANPLAYSKIFGVAKKGGNKTNFPVLYYKAAMEEKNVGLSRAYIKVILLKKGSAKNSYEIINPPEEIKLDKAERLLKSLAIHLRKLDGKKYHLRYIDKINGGYHFLLLKEASDTLFPAIPNNVRVLKGNYLLVSCNFAEKKFDVHTTAWKEALRIKSYFSRKLKSPIRINRDVFTYDPKTFFSPILEKKLPSALQLYDADLKKHNDGDSNLHLIDRHKKNPIVDTLINFKKKNTVRLEDFSEFRSFTFRFQELRFKVDFLENKWGQFKMVLKDSGIPPEQVIKFKELFKSVFKIPLGTTLQRENELDNTIVIAGKILDKTTLDLYLPPAVEVVLVKMISDGVLPKPTGVVKRKCINCYHVYWKIGDCPKCGRQAIIEGDFLDIQPDLSAINEMVFKGLRGLTGYTVKKTNKQIQSSKFTFLDIFNDKGESISLFITVADVPDKILSHFLQTGSPLMVVLVRHKAGLLPGIIGQGFAGIDFPSLYLSLYTPNFEKTIAWAIQDQKEKWKEKIAEKGYKSYQRFVARKENKYGDQDFETDIFNLFHEIFLIGDRLGGKFAGVAAPDGIISIQDYNNKISRYCLAWDCKYSVAEKGYNLNDPADKHRRYINVLKKNEKVEFYGGLQTYAIISQNMNMDKYEKFYQKLINRFQWKGQVIFIQANTVVELYKIYRDNIELISNYPKIFYSRLHLIFKQTVRRDSLPFKILTTQRLNEVMTLVKNHYEKMNRPFVFERKEF